ncbi:chromobox protein homolog 1-like isoform X1 [Nilaparvata lugens]|uniref:chromobox protein homolog 1-like isoform X1 n=1 Tax=Nilaparvata lugens TaxID=108931 RepID=UPI00193DB9EB|nr:chromobox protein homolog 1-like isoform X1 [Nilaparvata lugens]XP_039284579.1 chromobox protein homolog 1-like isoform X1 [Nilaparvata lugens]XP_039284580.1 chromobox protein homolog 1-like isoform X1 [Nilaparvata lugens]
MFGTSAAAGERGAADPATTPSSDPSTSSSSSSSGGDSSSSSTASRLSPSNSSRMPASSSDDPVSNALHMSLLANKVDRIVKMRKTRKGETEYLVHWKGCGSNDDTWEKESNLNCKKLIDEFLKNQVQDNTKDDKEKKKQTEKKKKDEVEEKKEEKNKDDGEEESSDSSCDGNEYEVEDIVDAKTEYLVKWKGWPSKYNSWVDEKDIYCENLIEDFLKNRKGASS